MIYIDVRPSYGHWPLWSRDGGAAVRNTDPSALGLPAALVADLIAWSDRWDATRDMIAPACSGFADPDEEDEFWVYGRRLAGRLAVAVGPDYRVEYYDGRYRRLTPVLTDHGVTVDGGRAVLPGHWRDVHGEPEIRDALSSELARELPAAHALAGRPHAAIAKCDACDDILIKLDDGAYAVVHLTWRRETDPNYPSAEVYADAGELLADLGERHA